MRQIEELRAQRRDIVRQIASLGEMRRGNVTEQYVDARHKDGCQVRRGPYPVYSFKEKGKTVSKRLKSPEEVETYRGQIEAFRKFQGLMRALVRVSEKLADRSVAGVGDLKKTPRRRSRRS